MVWSYFSGGVKGVIRFFNLEFICYFYFFIWENIVNTVILIRECRVLFWEFTCVGIV